MTLLRPRPKRQQPTTTGIVDVPEHVNHPHQSYEHERRTLYMTHDPQILSSRIGSSSNNSYYQCHVPDSKRSFERFHSDEGNASDDSNLEDFLLETPSTIFSSTTSASESVPSTPNNNNRRQQRRTQRYFRRQQTQAGGFPPLPFLSSGRASPTSTTANLHQNEAILQMPPLFRFRSLNHEDHHNEHGISFERRLRPSIGHHMSILLEEEERKNENNESFIEPNLFPSPKRRRF